MLNNIILYYQNYLFGKGKELYDEDELNFEGEYLSGKRNGKGKEFYLTNKLKFEGEYLTDKKLNGKGFDRNNKIKYELNNGKGSVKE